MSHIHITIRIATVIN